MRQDSDSESKCISVMNSNLTEPYETGNAAVFCMVKQNQSDSRIGIKIQLCPLTIEAISLHSKSPISSATLTKKIKLLPGIGDKVFCLNGCNPLSCLCSNTNRCQTKKQSCPQKACNHAVCKQDSSLPIFKAAKADEMWHPVIFEAVR